MFSKSERKSNEFSIVQMDLVYIDIFIVHTNRSNFYIYYVRTLMYIVRSMYFTVLYRLDSLSTGGVCAH